MRFVYQASPWRSIINKSGQFDPLAFTTPLESIVSRLFVPHLTLADSYASQLRLVEALARYDIPAWRISQVLSDHNAWLYQQAIALSLNEMRAQGWGAPPVDYCVVMLGSAARYESLLGPDQDNALIIDDYPDERHVEIDGYFQALGERFTQRLDEAGIPLCRGHVMARWPMWRKRLSEWRLQLEIWSADRRVKRVQQTNILLDFTPVAGNSALAGQLADIVSTTLPQASLFMDEMALLLDELPVALDRLGRIASSPRLEAPHRYAINLKHQGLLPLISALRLLCLRHKRHEIGTRERLMALSHEADGVSLDQADLLIAAFERFQQCLLEQQRYNKSRGQAADGWVDLRRLREDEALLLKFDLQQVKAFVQSVRGQR
ncbi:DUF294 nucleotidyltransferase-like domain-containing protein [Vreelandella venusta]|uniref:DUF294 nucleotidyltransferase-like domain-containing protein n=1 Tax=Vreelandella venusta TaxID=44935 RepID=UPI00384C3E0A